jgi:hypothetical protein
LVKAKSQNRPTDISKPFQKHNRRAKTEAELSAFLSDLNSWSADLKKEFTSEEPAPLRPRNNAVGRRTLCILLTHLLLV